MDNSSPETSPLETVSLALEDQPRTPEKEAKPKRGSKKVVRGPEAQDGGRGDVVGGAAVAAGKAGPSTFALIKEALAQSEEMNGLSYYAIRSYIAVRYPHIAARNGFVYRTKTALRKGLESGLFKRPKKDAELTKLSVGRFKLVVEKPKKPKKAPKEAEKKARRGRSTSPKRKTAVKKVVKAAARSLSADGAKVTKVKAQAKVKPAARSPSADRGKSPKRPGPAKGAGGGGGGATKGAAKGVAKPRPRSKTLAGAKGKVGKAAPTTKPAAKRASSSSPAPPKKARAHPKATDRSEGASQRKPKSKSPPAKPRASKKVKPKASEN